MIPQQQQQATAGMLAAARTPALSKEHKQEKEQPQKQKRQQQQDLCGIAIKVAGNEARNMVCECGNDIKFGCRERSPSGRGFC
jgi:hypothetical protein